MTQKADQFKAGMRRLAAGVSIVTTAIDQDWRGLTATAVCSVTAEPPTLLCCVNQKTQAHDALQDARILAVNILAEKDRDHAARFGGSLAMAERFTHGDWAPLETGAPTLIGAYAVFDCRVTAAIPAGTHTIFIAEVVAVRLSDEGAPLVYAGGDYAGLRSLLG